MGKGQGSDRGFSSSPIRFMPSPPGTPVRYSNLPSLDVVGLDDAYLADEEDSSDGEGDSDSSSMNMEV